MGVAREITLSRGEEGLGFSVVGGSGSSHGDLPIIIKSVFSRGAAAKDGRIKRGDQILAVNGESLLGVPHDQAVQMLKEVRGEVVLTILPAPDQLPAPTASSAPAIPSSS